ncbi:phosphonate ABC transporter, permease protein PhnE [Roseibium aestuarii]|uniref:Phosphonate ABC transporter, permease protein PhnE n=1 Tax=Roseibium aestuarii TaxID=2600299 RepID=A0ABW4JSR0_9HYPH|nr:phosphonate ABC transporter, permease protein PhnE [Roseibium aestuarii]
MTSLTASRIDALSARHPGVIDRPLSARLIPLGAFVALLAYLATCFITFDLPGVMRGFRGDMVQLFFLDSFAHKIHVVRRLTDDRFTANLEGARFAQYDPLPDWVQQGPGPDRIELGAAGWVDVTADTVSYFEPGRDLPWVIHYAKGEVPTLRNVPAGEPVPDWIRASEIQVDMRPSAFARIWITKSKIEIHRYFIGWENFFFDFSSPLAGKSISEIVSLAASGERIDPARSNLSLIASEFWNNEDWQHGEVAYALLQTVIMAVVGTLLAGILALPLAFAAARNINASGLARFGLRRGFDFLRGIDTLIWSLIFIRAFGLGPLSGIFAIVFTDTGAFGKLFSEAIENADRKQVEGIQATGASPVQKYRFGVFPQILPLFISQVLYFLESNTRSATVIGALGAGGIGLKLLETIRTRQDWENTLYIILLTIAVVILMDQFSGWLRRKLIDG